MKEDTVILDGENLSLEEAQQIASGTRVEISPEVGKRISASNVYVEKLALSKEPIYGVTTGFGYLANQKINEDQQYELQRNLLLSHAAGHGDPLPISETRLAMALRLNVLLKGFSGVRFGLCEALSQMLNGEIYPIIPEYGSVGASGDLAPLAHLALPLIGEGKVSYHGKVMPAAEALNMAGLIPWNLQKKEGLALINGTQVMVAVGSLALIEGWKLLNLADKMAALSYEALVGSPRALDPLIHSARGQIGQMESAHSILHELEGSYLFDPQTQRVRVQDPYSLRCAPQVHGPSRDAMRHTTGVVERELNASTDNPLVFADQEEILSGGNFHGQCLAMAFDFAAIALAEIGSISERRLELLLNPHLSGLPAFLAPKEGLNSGYMAAQYLSASLVNENKLLANPACTDSIPGNVGIEDHVSMGMTSARKFKKLVKNVRVILAVEMTAAAQGVDLRGVKKLGKGSGELYRRIREDIPMLDKDRIISEDIDQAVAILRGSK